jgi:GNAT superfamily N-acetyltransferase
MNAVSSQVRPIPPSRVEIDHERWVSIRPIERADASALSDFYARLSPESRHRRFLCFGGAPVSLVPGLAKAPGFVAILHEPGPLDGGIVAHASIQPDGHGSGEVAFAVADEVQGHGVGKRLVTMVLERARALHMAQVTASLLAGNAPMRHLLVDAGYPLLADRVDAGVEEIVLDAGAVRPIAA